MKKSQKNIGLKDVKPPKKKCEDKKCPFHGDLNVKPEIYLGKVIKKDTHHTANVEWERRVYLSKYERHEKRRSRVKAHNPPCIDAEVGDIVTIAKTRPLSKTKTFVIIKKSSKKK